MEKHLYHELIQRKLCMKANTQNIFMKQPKSSAIIDFISLIGHKLPNVQQIVNLLWHILHPPVAELFKMQVHLISSSFKAKKFMFQKQFPNWLISGTVLPESFDISQMKDTI